jgi:hypothetical protein
VKDTEVRNLGQNNRFVRKQNLKLEAEFGGRRME